MSSPVQTRTPRRRAPELRRAEILAAAEACFYDHGYHETTVDQIAERAGLSKGAIYWHFKGKRELFMALVERYVDQMLGNLEQVAQADAPAAVVVRGLFAVSLEETRRMTPIMELTLEYLCQAVRDVAVQSHIGRLYQRGAEMLSVPIQRGVDAGEFRSVDVEGAAAMLVSTLDGIALQATLNPALDVERAWKAAEDVFLRGLEA